MIDDEIYVAEFETSSSGGGDGGGTPTTSTPTSPFDLYAFNGNPAGITYANNRFYVLDEADDKMYVYTGFEQ